MLEKLTARWNMALQIGKINCALKYLNIRQKNFVSVGVYPVKEDFLRDNVLLQSILANIVRKK